MHSYRSLVAWQRAHRLCLDTYRSVRTINAPETFSLLDQIRRSALSVELNIVEGYALQTKALLRRHIRIAIGSAAELEAALNLLRELGALPEATAADLTAQTERTMAVLFGLLKTPTRP